MPKIQDLLRFASLRPASVGTHHYSASTTGAQRALALYNMNSIRPSPLIMPTEESLWATRKTFPVVSAPLKPLAAVAITACRAAPGGSLQWLMIKRGKAPSRGDWSLPGGSVELGESTLEAAKRELYEETGITESQAVFCADPFMCNDSITRDSNGRMLFHYLIAQIFAVVDPGAAVVAGDDALDAGWFSADEIEAGMRGRVTGDCARVIHRADLLRRAGCLSLPALNPSWLRMGGESSA